MIEVRLPRDSESAGATIAAPHMRLRISRITAETPEIRVIEFVDPTGAELPAFSAGAHVDVHIADDIVRQYSLCTHPAERHRYRIAVLRDKASRGGSIAIHALREGDVLKISIPRNNFPLAGPEARFHLLLAGGIGVTPMIAMLAELQSRGADFRMHYCTRSPEQTAFLAELQPLIASGNVILHHDDGDPKRGLDIAATLARCIPGWHIYVCGPSGFLAAAKAASSAWPAECLHFEHFSAVPISDDEAVWDKRPFKVKLKSSGRVFEIPAGRSIVSVLRSGGVAIETSCEDGFCGTCLTRYLEGEPVHRDVVLGEADRKNFVMICRARSRSPMLVLDL